MAFLLSSATSRQKLEDDLFCVTQERDYFKSKYLEQVSELLALKEELHRNRKEIQRLRKHVLKKSTSSQRTMNHHNNNNNNNNSSTGEEKKEDSSSRGFTVASPLSPSASQSGGGSTDYNSLPQQQPLPKPLLLPPSSSHHEGSSQEYNNDDNHVLLQQQDTQDTNDDTNDDHHDDHAHIRNNAAKLLQWANYRAKPEEYEHDNVPTLLDDNNDDEKRHAAIPETIHVLVVEENTGHSHDNENDGTSIPQSDSVISQDD